MNEPVLKLRLVRVYIQLLSMMDRWERETGAAGWGGERRELGAVLLSD